MKCKYYLLLFIPFLFSDCTVSLRGISIPPEVNSFFVEEFSIVADNAPPTANTDFTLKLRDKIQRESRLKFNDENPDVEFSGSITNFLVTSEAPQEDETSAFNRLSVTVRVSYYSHLNETEIFSENFTEQQDFGADVNLLSIQESLLDEIYEEVTERVFKKAFTDW